MSDHNLLKFGDDVMVEATVERGLMKTAPVRLQERVSVGLGLVTRIGVTIGSDVRIRWVEPRPEARDS